MTATVDHVIAECGRLRNAWAWLAEAVTPGRSRRNQRTLTPAAQAARDRQLAAERNDRAKLLTAGKLLAGNSSAPLNINAVDARDRIVQQVDDTAWKVASHLRNRVQLPYRAGQPAYRPDGASTNSRFGSALNWISTSAVRFGDGDQDIVNSAYSSLTKCTDLATAVSGAGTDRRPLAAECPSCGRRSLAWETSSPDFREWSVSCGSPKCRCAGRDCPCKLAGRQPGMTHVWLESAWERLAQQLASKETN